MKAFSLSFIIVVLLFILSTCCYAPKPDNQLVIWYKQPGKKWAEALPAGNIQFEVLHFSNCCYNAIQVNKNSVSAGKPSHNLNHDRQRTII